MRKKYGLKFQFQLIGSGQKHLITRIKGGNRGYDFDYNLIIPPPEEGYRYKANIIKQNFMNAFNIAVKGTEYSFSKDSTSVIKIKTVDKANSKIQYGCDFAIIYYEEDSGNEGYYYLRKNKKQQSYSFGFRSLINMDEKVNDICAENGWNHVREEYRKLKNINEGNNKKSFSLYIEAVNNVYNQMFN